MADNLSCCEWPGNDPQMRDYHDTEWGVVVRDDRALFAKLELDGFQAGLSWKTILHRRDHFLRVFEDFEPVRLAAWDESRIQAALLDPGIIRNRAKVRAAVTNAQAYLDMAAAGTSFSEFLWSFVGGRTIDHRFTSLSQLPTESAESQAMSKALKKAGFRFCGPTICYAFMQAVGMVNDHMVHCVRHGEVGGVRM
jgi:DNA-3-methyladenine glycosylase I